jgi:microcystin-dependent protein
MSTPYVGEIRMFGFPRIPSGWVACNGALLSIAQYEVLYTLLGTTYGGDGVTTFAVPDLRGQVPIHQGQGTGLSPYVMGQRGGSNQVTLLTPQMPQHSHAFNVTTATAGSANPSALQPGSLAGDTTYVTDTQGATPVQFAPQMVQQAGGSLPHPNCMPTLTVSFCIATEGVFPTQS